MIPPYAITDIRWDNEIMIVSFKNDQQIKFIGVKEWQYDNIVLSKNQRKDLEKLSKYIPNIPI